MDTQDQDRDYTHDGAEHMRAALRILDEQDRAIAAESARLDREDELDRAAYRAEAEALTALRETTRSMGIQNVITAANLARDGYDPGWDWQARAAALGIDKGGNPLTEGAEQGKGCAATDQYPVPRHGRSALTPTPPPSVHGGSI